MARQNVATANYEAMAKANMEAEIARSQVLVNVLGIGGRLGGMYAGGYFDKPQKPSNGTWSAPEKEPGSLDWSAGGESSGSMPNSIARHRP